MANLKPFQPVYLQLKIVIPPVPIGFPPDGGLLGHRRRTSAPLLPIIRFRSISVFRLASRPPVLPIPGPRRPRSPVQRSHPGASHREGRRSRRDSPHGRLTERANLHENHD